jgi:hypothetical protein
MDKISNTAIDILNALIAFVFLMNLLRATPPSVHELADTITVERKIMVMMMIWLSAFSAEWT